MFFFWYTPDSKLGYYFECNQTKNPDNDQNKWALELIKKLEPILEEKIGLAKKASLVKKSSTIKRRVDRPPILH